MAKNVVIAGATYSEVNKITVPLSGGSNVNFIDVSDSTIVANKLGSGVIGYDSSGNRVVGTLKFITPAIGFGKAEFYAPAANAWFKPISYSDYNIVFNYYGGSGCEELLFPITGLSAGAKYTLTFDETYNGGFIQDTYAYGCGIIQKSTYDSTSYPTGAAKPTWVTWHAPSAGTCTGTLTFTANNSTVYWGWALSKLKDSVTHTITINVHVYAA